MKDLDTLGVLGTQKTVFFQEPPIEYVQKIHILEEENKRLQAQLESDEMALTESQEIIAELKAQLKEANELLKSLTPLDRWQDDSNVNSYLKKWGVK